jgi:hypothetical protein
MRYELLKAAPLTDTGYNTQDPNIPLEQRLDSLESAAKSFTPGRYVYVQHLDTVEGEPAKCVILHELVVKQENSVEVVPAPRRRAARS